MNTNERKFRPVDLRPHEAQAAARGELRLIVRAVKPQPDGLPFAGWRETSDGGLYALWSIDNVGLIHAASARCPLGQPGDGLWGRESHYRFTGCAEDGRPWPGFIESPDGDPYNARCYDDYAQMPALLWACAAIRMSSILMPRWASRWSGVVEAVECRRVQTITNYEAMAAGAAQYAPARFWPSMSAVFREIFGDAWNANPWCWFVWVRQEGKS